MLMDNRHLQENITYPMSLTKMIPKRNTMRKSNVLNELVKTASRFPIRVSSSYHYSFLTAKTLADVRPIFQVH
jgi:hypothetical protein